jgi:hypothetical protein
LSLYYFPFSFSLPLSPSHCFFLFNLWPCHCQDVTEQNFVFPLVLQWSPILLSDLSDHTVRMGVSWIAVQKKVGSSRSGTWLLSDITGAC